MTIYFQKISHILQVAAGFQPFFPGVSFSEILTFIGISTQNSERPGHAI